MLIIVMFNYNYQHRNSNQYQQNSSVNRISRQSPNGRQTRISNNSKGKQEQAYKTYQQKLKALGRVRYKNPLAQLQYEEKLTQLHTKYSSKTKQSIQKKMKAKNQIAQFIDEQEEQLEQEFQQLMDYKYGASKWNQFHYQRQSNNKQYSFCSLCDQIHTSSQSEHDNVCKYQQYARSPLYYSDSLDRIKKCLSRMNSQQSVELNNIIQRIKKSQNVQSQLLQIMPYVKNDEVLGKIAAKLQQIVEETYQGRL